MTKVVKYYIFGAAVLFMVVIGLMSCRHSGKLQAIEVTPANAIIPIGGTQPFTAKATFSDGSVLDWTTASVWSSGDESIATVSNTLGFYGVVTALTASTATSTTTITATDTANNISGHVTLTVTTLPLISIAIEPSNAITSTGTSTITQFKATGTLADGTPLDYTPTVTWSSSNPGVATISNTAGSNGLVTAVAAGTTSITATDPATHVFEITTLQVE